MNTSFLLLQKDFLLVYSHICQWNQKSLIKKYCTDWTYIIMFLFPQLGYVVYRRVLRYYSGEEDGLGKHATMPDVSRLYLNLFLAMLLMLTHVNFILLQIWEKHYHKMLRRSPSYPSRGQSHLMNLNTIDIKVKRVQCCVCCLPQQLRWGVQQALNLFLWYSSSS